MRKFIFILLLAVQTLGCSGGEASGWEAAPGSGNSGQDSGAEEGQDSEKGVYVSAAEELKARGTVAAGTVVVWRNGLYSDQVAELKSAGTAEKPVVLRAEKPGSVCFTGTSRISVSGT